MNDAWTGFVLHHTAPLNIAFHLASAALYVACPLAALATWDPRWLLGFFGAGLVAALGHALSGEGTGGLTVQRVTFSAAVIRDVARMTALVLTGRWAAEIARARADAAP
jgi:hypothetical protein